MGWFDPVSKKGAQCLKGEETTPEIPNAPKVRCARIQDLTTNEVAVIHIPPKTLVSHQNLAEAPRPSKSENVKTMGDVALKYLPHQETGKGWRDLNAWVAPQVEWVLVRVTCRKSKRTTGWGVAPGVHWRSMHMAARDSELGLHSQLNLTRIVVFACPQVMSIPIGKVASLDCLQENLQADARGDLP
jgi:hypothetical protein